jgi:hypothetical protein
MDEVTGVLPNRMPATGLARVRAVLAAGTVAWALGWSVYLISRAMTSTQGPPGHGGIGVLLAIAVSFAIVVSAGAAALWPLVGGVLLTSFGVLGFVIAGDVFTKATLGGAAILLGLAAAVVRLIRDAHDHAGRIPR